MDIYMQSTSMLQNVQTCCALKRRTGTDVMHNKQTDRKPGPGAPQRAGFLSENCFVLVAGTLQHFEVFWFGFVDLFGTIQHAQHEINVWSRKSMDTCIKSAFAL